MGLSGTGKGPVFLEKRGEGDKPRFGACLVFPERRGHNLLCEESLLARKVLSNEQSFLNCVSQREAGWCVQRMVRFGKGRRHQNACKQLCFQPSFVSLRGIASVAIRG